MLITTKGIIFRAIKYSETSIIADVFTEKKGLRTYIISGVRKKNARVSASLMQVMSLVEMVVYHRDDKEMTRIKEIKSAHVYQSLPFDVRKSAVGQFILELTRKAVQEREENKSLFDFLYQSFQFLDGTELSFANFHLFYMLKLSNHLGFSPGGNYSSSTPTFDLREGLFVGEEILHGYFLTEEQSQILSEFLKADVSNIHEIKVTRETRKEFLKKLIIYYRLHIENFPDLNAHSILEEVME